MDENTLLDRITCDPKIFGGKPIIRGHRLAVEHVLGMLAAGDSIEVILSGYPWMEREDVLACLAYARRLVGHERVDLHHAAAPAVLDGVRDEVVHHLLEPAPVGGDHVDGVGARHEHGVEADPLARELAEGLGHPAAAAERAADVPGPEPRWREQAEALAALHAAYGVP